MYCTGHSSLITHQRETGSWELGAKRYAVQVLKYNGVKMIEVSVCVCGLLCPLLKLIRAGINRNRCFLQIEKNSP
jgi:hypothetical protein